MAISVRIVRGLQLACPGGARRRPPRSVNIFRQAPNWEYGAYTLTGTRVE